MDDEPGLGDRLVLLVGCRRSGTNWLHRILAAHPRVAIVPSETHLFSHGIAPLVERFHHGASASPRTAFLHMERDDLYDACRQFCDRALTPYLERVPDAAVLVERTPLHVHHLDLVWSVYPRARVLHIIRDGRDVARSLVSQEWGEHGPSDLADAAAEWRDAIRGARGAAGGDRRYHEVRYEELFEHRREVIEDVYTWLGLGAAAERVEAALAESSGRFNVDRAAPAVQTAKWRDSLSLEDLRSITEVAGQTLLELGYTTDDEPAPQAASVGLSDGPGATEKPAATTPASAPMHRKVRRALGRRRRSDPAPRRGGASTYQMELEAQTVDTLLTALHTGRLELAPPTSTDVKVRVADADVRWTARGDEAMARLFDAVRAHGATVARQHDSDMHPGSGTFAVVITYEGPDDARWDALYVVHPRGERVVGISYYRFPLSPVPGGTR